MGQPHLFPRSSLAFVFRLATRVCARHHARSRLRHHPSRSRGTARGGDFGTAPRSPRPGRGGVLLPTEGVAPSQTALGQAIARQSSVITEDLNLSDLALHAPQSIVAQSLRAVVAI